MEEDKKPIIDKDTSKRIGFMFFGIILCPIIIYVLITYNIPFDPRLIAYVLGLLGFLLFGLFLLAGLLLHLLSPNCLYLKYLKIRVKLLGADTENTDNVYFAAFKNKSEETFGFIFMLTAFILIIGAIYYITWGK